VYSSPKPTQPDSSTIGESNRRPQKSRLSEEAGEVTSTLRMIRGVASL